jgi:hypothetical protein
MGEMGWAAAGLRLAARAADREERIRTWAGFGPGEKERRKGTFFIQKSFLFCSPNPFCYFGNNMIIQTFLEYFKVTMDLLYI